MRNTTACSAVQSSDGTAPGKRMCVAYTVRYMYMQAKCLPALRLQAVPQASAAPRSLQQAQSNQHNPVLDLLPTPSTQNARCQVICWGAAAPYSFFCGRPGCLHVATYSHTCIEVWTLRCVHVRHASGNHIAPFKCKKSST